MRCALPPSKGRALGARRGMAVSRALPLGGPRLVHLRLVALFVPADLFRHADRLGSNFDELALGNVLDRRVERQLERGGQTLDDALVRRAHVRQLLRLADIDAQVAWSLVDADDHVLVDTRLGRGEEEAAILGAHDAKGRGLALLEGEQGALRPLLQDAHVGSVRVKVRVDDRRAARGGEELRAQADGAARRKEVLDVRVVADLSFAHVLHLALAAVQQINNRGRVLVRGLDLDGVERLRLDAVDQLDDDLGRADLELKALAAHGLDQHGKVERPAAGDLEGVAGVGGLDLQRDVAVELLVKAVADHARGELVAVAAGEGGLVHAEGHGHRRLLDDELGEGQRRRLLHESLADLNVRHARKHDDLAGGSRLHGRLAEVGVDKQVVDLDVAHGVLGAHHGAECGRVARLEHARADAADAELALEVVKVNVRH
mmetsp:Transcript_20253/g.68611  ORF Transcript_20253/g.68611 Transcript_20253/m.68611 type:complete len:431 (+) Transcript_20253:84-1376(+)